jgi:HSP20 family protein
MMPVTFRRSRGWNSPFGLIENQLGQALSQLWNESQPMENVGVYPVDIHEDDNHIYVEAEVPGFSRDQINVTLEKDVLTIQAQREVVKSDKDNDNATRHLSERRYTRVSRAFSLPNTVDENKVDARLENGVLYLTLHKREEVKPRRIEVK